MVIYKITNKINGKRYIGQTINSVWYRWKDHKNHFKKGVSLLSRAIKKYGPENFEIRIVCRCNTIEEMNHREIYCIKLFNTQVPNGYNIDGGGRNKTISEETRRRMSESQKGKHCGALNGMYGKTHSLEVRFATSVRGRAMVGNKNSMYGKRRTEENKKHISEKLKGRETSQKQKLAASIANKGKIFSSQHVENLSKSNNWRKIEIFCTNNNKKYSSIMEASKDLNLSSGNISKVLKGIGKSVKGFIFIKLSGDANASNDNK